MLRNVLADYLDRATERELDLPTYLLLPELGFHDVHFTHGAVEFGKDFIAKKWEDGAEVQYSFQSKVGDIGQADWRNTIQGQILESVLSSLSHPNFDARLPHQVVLLTTGDLKGNARLEMQNLNTRIQEKYKERPIIFWGRENLVTFFEQHGLVGIHHTTASGYAEHGRFFLIYGDALRGNVSCQEIEEYSRQWIDTPPERDRRLLRCAVEAEVLAQRCLEHGRFFEAIYVHLARLRMICASVYLDGPAGDLAELYAQAIARLRDLCSTCLTGIRQRWQEGRDLLTTIGAEGGAGMTVYLAQCSRIMEIVGLLYFTTRDADEKRETATFLADFLRAERGCGHPLSDRYTVGVVLTTVILYDRQETALARTLLTDVTNWLCDRYERGLGLASVEADELVETNTLLGYPFASVPIDRPTGSFLATAVCDLAAFLGDEGFYSDVVNDIIAAKIYPEYWQAQDSAGVCRIESADVIEFPNIRYEDTLTDFREYRFAEHIRHEVDSFRVAEALGPQSLVMLAVFLRDRYFPKAWPILASNHPSTPAT
jgi:hypothetical protein